ncbi:Apolipoprotein N-acyltransferase [bacterium HR15]|nr:Apolipoprotein N-acyltransferase [bacterium HR15]
MVREWGVLTLSAVLTGLAFAPVGWWWTLLFAPALWLAVLHGGSVRANVARSFWWMLVYGATMSWHAAPIFAQEAKAEWAGGVAWALALAWFGLWGALFGGLIGGLSARGGRWVLGVASGWVVVQWGRSLGVLGFPWAMLSLGLARVPLFLQPAELGGIWLTEWLLMLWNALLVQAWHGSRRTALTALTLLGAVWLGFSVWAWQRVGEPMRTSLSVAVVQPYTEQSFQVFSLSIFDERMGNWLAQARQQGARWAVLPEVVEPVLINTLSHSQDEATAQRLTRWRQWSRGHNLFLLVGVDRFDGVMRNSAVLVSPEAALRFYDKVKLMAFVEWSPRGLWSRPFKVLGLRERSLQSGERVHALRAGSAPAVGVSLCVESLFGWVAREQVRTGAQWLAVMANDYWLIGRLVREQYADFCVVRAIETRRWVVRASSVGLSGFYAPTGKLVSSLPMGRAGLLTYRIEPRTEQTLYVRWGDWWVYLCLAAMIVLWLGQLSSTNRRRA